MPNDNIVTLRAPSHLVERITMAASRECQSMAAFVRRALVRELQRSEAEFGSGPEASQ